MKCDICGKDAKTWGHSVCLECYITPKAKDKQLAIYKRALELACETVVSQEIDGDDYFDVVEYWKMNNDKYADELGVEGGSVMDYFLEQAKKELEEQDGNQNKV